MLEKIWQISFKLLLVPGYKLFLFTKKNIQKYLVNNPYLSTKQIKLTSIRNSPAHIIIAFIFIFVLANNLATKDTYAEELNQKSIIAQLFVTDIEQEIIEKSPDFRELSERPKTESVINQLAALEATKKTNGQQIKTPESTDQLALSQGGQALIQPTATLFESTSTKATSQPPNPPARKKIQTYLVQSGDTLGAIAAKFGISINTILWENNLSLSSYIRPGDKLKILPTTGISYTIRSGDTLGGIAKSHGTTIEKILAFNDLESAASIKTNQKLIIPDGKLGYTTPPRSRSIYSSAAPSANNFLWPSVSKRITQYYHWRHHAIDIGAKLGTPIYASQAGRVERSGWSTGYGYNVVINHGSGVKTLYAHASKLYVKRGDQIKQGEIIAAIGSTGWSTGPHVHFEIIINGTKVNPLSYL